MLIKRLTNGSKSLVFAIIWAIVLSLGLPPAYASQLVVIDEFKSLDRSTSADKIENGGHAKFDNAVIQDGKLQVIKGRDRLNDTAHTDTTVNMLCYYRNRAGTTTKLVVKESNDLVTYDTDGTNRTVISENSVAGADANDLTDEKADCVQIGDTLYINSSTDGLIKWTGTGLSAAVGSVSAPSSVNFTVSSNAGGLTPGTSIVAGVDWDADATCSRSVGGTCTSGAGCLHIGGDADDAGVFTDCVNKPEAGWNCVDATDTNYKYKVVKYDTETGIESEPSSAANIITTGSI